MKQHMISAAVCTLASLVAIAGCEEKSAPTPADWPAVPNSSASPTTSAPASAPPAPASSGATGSATGGGIELAGLVWSIPADWQSVGASGMRIAEYSVSTDAGIASIRFFSTQGTAQMNIDRWKGQVKDPTDGPTATTITSGSIVAHIVKITGTYSGMGPSGSASPPTGGTRMLGAFVEGGPRPVQILVTGPDEAVRSVESSWEKMLSEVHAP